MTPPAEAAARRRQQGQRAAEAEGAHHAVAQETRILRDKVVVGERVDDQHVDRAVVIIAWQRSGDVVHRAVVIIAWQRSGAVVQVVVLDGEGHRKSHGNPLYTDQFWHM